MLKKAYKYIIILAVLTVSAIILAGCTSVFCAHEWTVWKSTVAADCRETSGNIMVCALCDKAKFEMGEPGEHVLRENGIVKRSTCTEEGQERIVCVYCDYEEISVIPMQEHAWDDGTVLSQPTCAERGKIKFTCTDCGYEEEEPYGKLQQHVMVYVDDLVPAQCLQGGRANYKCQNCSFVTTASTPSLGHDLVEDEVLSEPQCESLGRSRYGCSRCSYSEIRSIPKLGHDRVEQETKKPTCTSKGEKNVTCSRCDYEAIEDIPPLEHDFGENGLCKDCGIGRPTAGLTYTLKADGTYELTKIPYDLTGKLIIASYYEGVPVTSVASGVAWNQDGITELYIPSTIKEIKYKAFMECAGLTEIEFSEGLEKIGYNAFSNCEALTEVRLPESLTVMESSAFYWCTKLHTVTLSPSLTELSTSVFAHTALHTVHNLDKIEKICTSAFSSCAFTSINLGGETTEIGATAFYENKQLESVTIGGKVAFDTQSTKPFLFCKNIKRFTLTSSEMTEFYLWQLKDSYSKIEYIVLGESIKKITYDDYSNININIFSYAKRGEVTTNYTSSDMKLYYFGEWEYVDGVPTPNK